MVISRIDIFKCLVFSLIFACSSVLYASEYKVVSEDENGITVEIRIKGVSIDTFAVRDGMVFSLINIHGFSRLENEDYPIIPAKRLVFSIPQRSNVTLEILDSSFYRKKLVIPSFSLDGKVEKARVLDELDVDSGAKFVRLSGSGTYRKKRVAFVDIFPVLFSKKDDDVLISQRVVFRLNFHVASSPAKHSDPFLNEAVLNDVTEGKDVEVRNVSQFQGQGFEFSLSSNWIKISVYKPGIYCITYDDILSLGIDPSQIDPATIRMYTTTPLAQPDSIKDGGSFEDSYHMDEIAIIVTSSGGVFQPGDSIIFYGVGADIWSDYMDTTFSKKRFIRNIYDSKNVYWLTWDGDFEGVPKRITTRIVGSSGGFDIEVSSYEARIHVERNLLYDPIHTDDGWYWRYLHKGGTTSFSDNFNLTEIFDGKGIVRSICYGPYDYTSVNNSASFYINGQYVGEESWTTANSYSASSMKIFEGSVVNLRNGSNTFMIVKPVNDVMYVQWYEVFYNRYLTTTSGILDFFSPDTTAIVRFRCSGFSGGEIILLDVSDYKNPVKLVGFSLDSDTLLFVDVLNGKPHHYFVSKRDVLLKPSLALKNVVSLRDEDSGPDMVIIYHPDFKDAALRLKEHREKKLPYKDNPYVKAVNVEDVYDNFSGGKRDVIAIRNYIKFLYDNFTVDSFPILKYVLIIGEGTYDYRNYLGRGNCFIPLYMNRYFTNEDEAIEDEDFLTKLDDGDDRVPDIAIGRLSVVTTHEANAWVDRIIRYENNPEYGSWKNKIIVVADDEFSSNRDDDFVFMIDAEELTSRNGPIPTNYDIRKIYLHTYPFVGGSKPGAKNDLIEEWSEGALIVNYAGHGSPVQMADELVMLNPDIYSLTNDNRRPLFLAFSCSVGNLDSPYQRSIAQNIVNFDGGGAIATMCATAPTYGHPNSILNEEVFEKLFVSKDSTTSVPIGLTLQLAKMHVISAYSFEKNSAKYALLGDPAMTLCVPRYIIKHDISDLDTLRAGFRYGLQAGVYDSGYIRGSFHGQAEVIVQEAENKISERLIREGITYRISYTLPGNVLFRGTVDVTEGLFDASFVVPTRCRVGSGARIRSYAYGDGVDAAGACDTLVVILPDSLPTNNDAPRINMYFAGMATKVKSGSRLIAEISDNDGIAILGSEPQNSILLEFDNSGFPIFVTDYFRYDHGSFTKGRVEYPLHSGFEEGEHSAILRAFDNLGASATDTFYFEIIGDSLYMVTDVFNFPNPFNEGTNFVFQLSNDADVKLEVFNVSGFRVWEKEISGVQGFNSIYWDGRDFAGDRIANGTYIYQLTIRFKGSFHREEKVRGKVIFLK